MSVNARTEGAKCICLCAAQRLALPYRKPWKFKRTSRAFTILTIYINLFTFTIYINLLPCKNQNGMKKYDYLTTNFSVLLPDFFT